MYGLYATIIIDDERGEEVVRGQGALLKLWLPPFSSSRNSNFSHVKRLRKQQSQISHLAAANNIPCTRTAIE